MSAVAKGTLTEVGKSVNLEDIAVAVVIPVFKHPGLLIEAINSALKQVSEFSYSIVIVNDGCQYNETEQICSMYAENHPDKIYHYRKMNGGLSSARNSGIDFSLNVFPNLQAVYLLDADNIISTTLIQRSFDLLMHSEQNVAWIYPDIDKFGIEEFAFVGGEYYPLEHLCWNFCEAGSMLRAEVLKTGLRYDESMKNGYEDWEFWLQCLSKGYRGRHLPASGFRYRQRSESMLRESERQHQMITQYIQTKHKDMFSVDNVLRHEQLLHRFLVYFNDIGTFASFTDPHILHQTTASELSVRIGKSLRESGFSDLPPLLLVTNSRSFEFLNDNKLLASVLWDLQRNASRSGASTLSIEFRSGSPTTFHARHGEEAKETHLFLCPTIRVLDEIRATQLADTFLGDPMLTVLTFAVPFDPPNLTALNEPLRKIRTLFRAVASSTGFADRRLTAVQYQRARLSLPSVYTQAICGVSNILPISKKKDVIDVGLLMPIFSFGGVEKVAIAYAQQLHRAGIRVHFFISSRQPATLSEDVLRCATTINYFCDNALGKYAPSVEARDYLGAPMTEWPMIGDLDAAVGLLCTMNGVINFNFDEFNSVMGRLKQRGVVTATSQHLVDISPFGQPAGTPHQILAYEHAYHKILVISDQLRHWFIGMGVPRQKLMLLRNGPGYEMEARVIQQTVQERKRDKCSLHALFLGRFDQQKGLDRLATLISSTSNTVKWRVVGKGILTDQGFDLTPIKPFIYPLATSKRDLNHHYGWADVMVLMSRFEGVPLSIIEAGRVGCIPIATNVGAVHELIVHGESGFLINAAMSDADIVKEAEDIIMYLKDNPDKRSMISNRAAAHFQKMSWIDNTKELINFFKKAASL